MIFFLTELFIHLLTLNVNHCTLEFKSSRLDKNAVQISFHQCCSLVFQFEVVQF